MAFLVALVDLTAERMQAGRAAILADAVKGGIAQLPGAKVTAESDLELAGFPGRGLTLQAELSGMLYNVHARAFLVQSRLYVLTAVAPASASAAECHRFLQSFSLISQ